jgi:tRNA-binding protein
MMTLEDFNKVDIRVGNVISAQVNTKALKPAILLQIDFGVDIGIKGSSAQLCANYSCEDLVNRQVLAIVNLPPRRVAGFKSEVLVLAVVCERNGTVLIRPDRPVEIGQRLA